MLYEILKSAKLGTEAAPDMFTGLLAQKMPFAKGSGEIAELSGVLPLTFKANGQPLLDWYIKGNTVQNGTPTPANPVEVNGVGERTGNLWNYTIQQGGWFASPGTTPTPFEPGSTNYIIRCRVPYMIPISSNTMSLTCPSDIKINFVWLDANGVSMGGTGWQQSGSTVTAPENATTLTFILAKVDDSNCSPNDFQNIMLNSGSTAKPYEPPGYKIPVTCGDVTTDVYIGDSPLYDGDSISMSDTGIVIPTVRGKNILTVDTTVQPSEVYIKYKK